MEKGVIETGSHDMNGMKKELKNKKGSSRPNF